MAPITELSPCMPGVKTRRLEPSPLAVNGQGPVRFPGYTGDTRTMQGREQVPQNSRPAHNEDRSLGSSEEAAPEVPPKSPHLVTKAPNGHGRVPACENASTQKNTTPAKRDMGLNTGYYGLAVNGTETQLRAPTPEKGELFAPWVNSSSRTESPSKKQVKYVAGSSQTDLSCSISENQIQPTKHHKRDKSEDSIMNRGRPKKKRPHQEQLPIRERHEVPDVTTRALPLGTPVHMASMTLPCEEVEKLQNQAREQADRFEVLKYREVRSLSKVRCRLSRHYPWKDNANIGQRRRGS